MSTTLTNGLKLPDKGSVDWYADMQSNYTILDGAVGTVAAHTAALAGKAPAVHTHTKSDVTDLLNSNFIPSANNTYDLGSSSYQWNNAYIKSLTINGVACGDILTHNVSEFVHIKGSDDIIDSKTFISLYTQSGGPSLWMKNTSFTIGTAPTTNRYSGIWVQDNNGTDTAYIVHQANKNNSQNLRFSVSNTDGTTVYQNALTFQGRLDGTFNFYSDNPANLGTSTNKWKSFNGVNPGALSLPSGAAENIDTTNWDFSWSANTVTAPFDGYISIACFGSALQINNETKSYAMTYAPGSDGFICGLLPVSSGDSIKVLVTRTQTSIYEGYKFIKANGNV